MNEFILRNNSQNLVKVKKISKELLEKFTESRCSEDEKQKVISWFIENGNDITLKSIMENHFDEILENDLSELESPEILTLLDEVHHKINVRNFKKDRINPFRKVISHISRVAAILFVPLLIASWILTVKYLEKPSDDYVEIVTPSAARIHFTLPDGSSGWLNSESTLRYRAGMHGSEREVELQGEGFFSVVKNPNRPFIVKSENIEVKVLGTKFNVNTYPENSNIEVTLQSGKVEMYGITNSKEKTRIAKLLPGEKVSVSKNNLKSITKTKVEDSDLIAAWIDDVMVFRGEEMTIVAKRLSRRFGVDVRLQNEEIKDYKLHATFQQESLEEILKLIKLTSPIDYKITERKKQINGTYSKEKIFFSKRNIN